MAKSTSWDNVKGYTYREFVIRDGRLYDAHDEAIKLPQELLLIPGFENIIEVEIAWKSSGHYSPAIITADPYYSSPEEGSDERLLDCVIFHVPKESPDIVVPKELQEKVFELYETEVAEEELPIEEEDEPEPERDF